MESGQWLFPMRGGEIYPDKPSPVYVGIALGYLLTGSIKVAFPAALLLAGLLTIALVWGPGAPAVEPGVGLSWAGLLLLLTVQFTLQAKTAQIDALVPSSSPWGLWLRALPALRGGWRWYWLGWFAAGLGIITKGVGLLALLILIPAVWTHRRKIRAASRADWLEGAGGAALHGAGHRSLVGAHVDGRCPERGSSAAGLPETTYCWRQTVTRMRMPGITSNPFWYHLSSR